MRRIQHALVRWFSRRVGRAGPERLARAMRGPWRRRALLGLIFRAMPRAVRRRARQKERVVIEWHITGRADERHDVRQLRIGDGSATMFQGEPHDPDLTITVDGVDFLLLATGNADPPKMFVQQRIAIEGDLWLAMRLPRIFATGGRPHRQ